MNILQEDSIKLIRSLYEKKVCYILVGGIAVIYYGYGRTTGDMDIWLEDNPENRKAFIEAIRDYGIDGVDAYLTLPLIAGYSEIMLDSGMYLDIMANLKKYTQADFQECYSKCNDWQPEPGIHVKVLQINQLIQEKEFTTRHKDKEDAEQLRKIRDQGLEQ